MTIKSDIITRERIAKRDVRVLPGSRGGIEFRVRTNLDVLLENDIITESQASMGRVWWGLRECALRFLDVQPSPAYGESPCDEIELEARTEDFPAEAGVSTEIYFSLLKTLSKCEIEAINLCCSYSSKIEMTIIWALGVNTIRWSFEALEKKYDGAKEEAIARMRDKKNACGNL